MPLCTYSNIECNLNNQLQNLYIVTPPLNHADILTFFATRSCQSMDMKNGCL